MDENVYESIIYQRTCTWYEFTMPHHQCNFLTRKVYTNEFTQMNLHKFATVT